MHVMYDLIDERIIVVVVVVKWTAVKAYGDWVYTGEPVNNTTLYSNFICFLEVLGFGK